MSKVDWSLAPVDATHYLPDSETDYECWVRKGYSMRVQDQKEWHSDKAVNKDIKHGRTIERPKQPEAWSGPQDGLPPVGWCSVGKMVQVMSLPTHYHEDVSIYLSKPSKIVSSYTDDDGGTFLMLRIDCDFGTGYECFAAHRVLPAKTENQIDAKQRETAIREIMDIADVDCRVTAARLVDAGFKWEVV